MIQYRTTFPSDLGVALAAAQRAAFAAPASAVSSGTVAGAHVTGNGGGGLPCAASWPLSSRAAHHQSLGPGGGMHHHSLSPGGGTPQRGDLLQLLRAENMRAALQRAALLQATAVHLSEMDVRGGTLFLCQPDLLPVASCLKPLFSAPGPFPMPLTLSLGREGLGCGPSEGLGPEDTLGHGPGGADMTWTVFLHSILPDLLQLTDLGRLFQRLGARPGDALVFAPSGPDCFEVSIQRHPQAGPPPAPPAAAAHGGLQAGSAAATAGPYCGAGQAPSQQQLISCVAQNTCHQPGAAGACFQVHAPVLHTLAPSTAPHGGLLAGSSIAAVSYPYPGAAKATAPQPFYSTVAPSAPWTPGSSAGSCVQEHGPGGPYPGAASAPAAEQQPSWSVAQSTWLPPGASGTGVIEEHGPFTPPPRPPPAARGLLQAALSSAAAVAGPYPGTWAAPALQQLCPAEPTTWTTPGTGADGAYVQGHAPAPGPAPPLGALGILQAGFAAAAAGPYHGAAAAPGPQHILSALHTTSLASCASGVDVQGNWPAPPVPLAAPGGLHAFTATAAGPYPGAAAMAPQQPPSAVHSASLTPGVFEARVQWCTQAPPPVFPPPSTATPGWCAQAPPPPAFPPPAAHAGLQAGSFAVAAGPCHGGAWAASAPQQPPAAMTNTAPPPAAAAPPPGMTGGLQAAPSTLAAPAWCHRAWAGPALQCAVQLHSAAHNTAPTPAPAPAVPATPPAVTGVGLLAAASSVAGPSPAGAVGTPDQRILAPGPAPVQSFIPPATTTTAPPAGPSAVASRQPPPLPPSLLMPQPQPQQPPQTPRPQLQPSAQPARPIPQQPVLQPQPQTPAAHGGLQATGSSAAVAGPAGRTAAAAAPAGQLLLAPGPAPVQSPRLSASAPDQRILAPGPAPVLSPRPSATATTAPPPGPAAAASRRPPPLPPSLLMPQPQPPSQPQPQPLPQPPQHPPLPQQLQPLAPNLLAALFAFAIQQTRADGGAADAAGGGPAAEPARPGPPAAGTETHTAAAGPTTGATQAAQDAEPGPSMPGAGEARDVRQDEAAALERRPLEGASDAEPGALQGRQLSHTYVMVGDKRRYNLPMEFVQGPMRSHVYGRDTAQLILELRCEEHKPGPRVRMRRLTVKRRTTVDELGDVVSERYSISGLIHVLHRCGATNDHILEVETVPGNAGRLRGLLRNLALVPDESPPDAGEAALAPGDISAWAGLAPGEVEPHNEGAAGSREGDDESEALQPEATFWEGAPRRSGADEGGMPSPAGPSCTGAGAAATAAVPETVSAPSAHGAPSVEGAEAVAGVAAPLVTSAPRLADEAAVPELSVRTSDAAVRAGIQTDWEAGAASAQADEVSCLKPLPVGSKPPELLAEGLPSPSKEELKQCLLVPEGAPTGPAKGQGQGEGQQPKGRIPPHVLAALEGLEPDALLAAVELARSVARMPDGTGVLGCMAGLLTQFGASGAGGAADGGGDVGCKDGAAAGSMPSPQLLPASSLSAAHLQGCALSRDAVPPPALQPGELRLCGLTFHPELAPGVRSAMEAWEAGLAEQLAADGLTGGLADAAPEQLQIRALESPATSAAGIQDYSIAADVALLLGLTTAFNAPLPEHAPQLCPSFLAPGRDEGCGGAGLFTAAALPKGAVLGVVGGYVMPRAVARRFADQGFLLLSQDAKAELAARAGPGPEPGPDVGLVRSAWQLLEGAFRLPMPGSSDGWELSMLGYGSLAALINDPRREPRGWVEGNDVGDEGGAAAAGANCAVVPVSVRGLTLPVVVALRDIQPGEQLLRDYGAEWWRRHEEAWGMAEHKG